MRFAFPLTLAFLVASALPHAATARSFSMGPKRCRAGYQLIEVGCFGSVCQTACRPTAAGLRDKLGQAKAAAAAHRRALDKRLRERRRALEKRLRERLGGLTKRVPAWGALRDKLRRTLGGVENSTSKLAGWLAPVVDAWRDYTDVRRARRRARRERRRNRRRKPADRALVVCIENDNKDPVFDARLEKIAAENMSVWAARYRHGEIITDCSVDRLRQALAKVAAHKTDIAILAHGFHSRQHQHTAAILNSSRLSAVNIPSLKQVNPNIHAVYQQNCWGAKLRGAWLAAGARAVAGSREINFQVLSYNNFFRAWTRGKTFRQAVAAINKAKRHPLGAILNLSEQNRKRMMSRAAAQAVCGVQQCQGKAWQPKYLACRAGRATLSSVFDAVGPNAKFQACAWVDWATTGQIDSTYLMSGRGDLRFGR